MRRWQAITDTLFDKNERRSKSDRMIPTRERFSIKHKCLFIPLYSGFVLKRWMGGKDGVQRCVNVLRYLPNVTNSVAGRRIGFGRQTALSFPWIILLTHCSYF